MPRKEILNPEVILDDLLRILVKDVRRLRKLARTKKDAPFSKHNAETLVSYIGVLSRITVFKEKTTDMKQRKLNQMTEAELESKLAELKSAK